MFLAAIRRVPFLSPAFFVCVFALFFALFLWRAVSKTPGLLAWLQESFVLTAAEQTALPEGGAPLQAATNSTKKKKEKVDLLDLSPEMVQMLATLGEQQEGINRREETFEVQEKQLLVLKAELAKRLKQIEKVEQKLEAMVKEQEALDSARVKSLVKVFESMKPAQAAPILSKMDARSLLFVLTQMKGQKIAAILAQLPPEEAANISVVLTGQAQGKKVPFSS